MWNHGSGPSVWLEDGRHWRVSMPLMSTMTVLNATAWGMAKANATIQIQAIIIWKWIQWLIILVLWVTGFLDNFWHWDANEPMGGTDRKNLICLEGKRITLGKDFSFPFLPATPSSQSQTLEGRLELTWRPSRALNSPLASEVFDTIVSVSKVRYF